MSQTKTGPDGNLRCSWSLSAPEFLHYHDREWGFPVADDRRLFEKLCLEGFQSGLSWRTVLAKRDNFRAAFHQFDFDRIARFTERDVERLIKDEGIIRHRGKIESVINNAKRANELVKQEGSLAAYFWHHERAAETLAKPQSASTSVVSITLSKELKKRGWRANDSVCLHAGDGTDQRPCGRLCRQSKGRACSEAIQTAAKISG
jgi:DNA-3-methyladenine glycosylase I